jgi:hypothetical protein
MNEQPVPEASPPPSTPAGKTEGLIAAIFTFAHARAGLLHNGSTLEEVAEGAAEVLVHVAREAGIVDGPGWDALIARARHAILVEGPRREALQKQIEWLPGGAGTIRGLYARGRHDLSDFHAASNSMFAAKYGRVFSKAPDHAWYVFPAGRGARRVAAETHGAELVTVVDLLLDESGNPVPAEHMEAGAALA